MNIISWLSGHLLSGRGCALQRRMPLGFAASAVRAARLAMVAGIAGGMVGIGGCGGSSSAAAPAGPVASLSTTSIAFASMVAGGSEAAQTVTVTNTGTAVLDITGISITGTGASDFSETNTCGATVAVAGNCTVTVSFSAATAGSYTATLAIANNASTGGSATVALSGTATVPPVAQASLSASTLTFSSMAAGSVSTAQTVTLTNTGGATLNITSIALSGTGVNLFSKTTTCGATLAAGANCTISATFGPKVAGTYAATLTLTDNANATAGTTQTVAITGTATAFVIAVNNSTASDWHIDNGAIAFDWNSTTGNLWGWVLDGYSDQLVDTTTTSNGHPDGLYMDNTGTFDSGSSTAACTVVGGTVTGSTTCTTGSGSTPYFDWSQTIASSGTNAYTFTEHWVVFPNDPGVHTYVVLNHKTTDIAGSVGQVQWVFRDSLSIFTNTYEVNSGLNLLGVESIPQPSVTDTGSSDPGRAVQNAAEDLHGFTDLPTGFTREFYTKYDYAGYEVLHQAHGVFGAASSGTTYGVWTVLPRLETLVGGPTKQDLYFTNNIDMVEAYSNHDDQPINLNTAAAVAYNRLFGPYYYHVNVLGQAYNQTGNTLATPADMYADAVQAGSTFTSLYDNVAPLVSSGYVTSTARGSVSLQINGVTGAARTAWAVLSDPATNFQISCNGYQYWADISASGAATISGVAPGTYRLSVYVLGQWGELRQENIVVAANQTTVVPAVSFVPENFGGTTTPVFTIGTPDRSAHEFLHGHTANGNEDREFYGAWNYWADFLANNGAVVYYATADGSTPATNDLTKWNYNHWGTSFDPGLYDPANDTTDGYSNTANTYGNGIPAYVAGLTGASGTNGVTTGIPAWQVHFATPANYATQAYVVLSVAIACDEGSYVIALNGHSYTWSRTNESDCMVRSGLSGYTQWFAMQWPTSDLTQSSGGDNVISIGMSQADGASDDALRLELTNTSAAPATTGWNDYTFLNGTTTFNNDAVANP